MNTHDDHLPEESPAEQRLTTALRAALGGAPSEPPSAAVRSAVSSRLDEIEAAEAAAFVSRPAESRWRRYVVWTAGGGALSISACVAGYAYMANTSFVNSMAQAKRSDLTSRQLSKPTKGQEEGWAHSSDAESEKLVILNPTGESLRSDEGRRTLDSTVVLTSPQPAHEASVATLNLNEQLEQARPSHSSTLTSIAGTGAQGREISTKGYIVSSAGSVAYSPVGARLSVRGEEGEVRIWREKGRELEGKFTDELRFTGGEQYDTIVENRFLPVDKATALSTFSIDVDTASYSNVRRFLSQGQLPPPHAVRIEELLNYFRYSYPPPQGADPFSVNMELADCPWQPGHQLLRVGLKGRDVQAKERKPGNLVFLVDVSGSMQPENKLPLLKQALKMLAGELTENDKVTIVTYAGDAGLKLDVTNGTNQQAIRDAIDALQAGGSTHGSAGLELAYQKAAQSFVKDGTNRVILATDGDLNVGITSDEALVDLIKTKAAGGVFLTVLGVGDGNLKDSKMEKLADNGNGVYAYLDSLREARKVLVEQLSGSLETIAKDVKLQIEFNPAEVAAYRLVGYENRVLAERDFNDDKKDAGEIGAGHTVTALYELVPARAKPGEIDVGKPGETAPLKYQRGPEPPKVAPESLTPAAGSGEVLTLKLRFKQPDAQTSQLREYPLKSDGGRFNRASADFQFAAAVASFGMLLRGSEHRGDATFSAVEEIASGAVGADAGGYRAEFLDLVRKAKTMQRQ